VAQHNEVKALTDMLAAAAAQHAKELRGVREESTRLHEAYVEKTSKVCGGAGGLTRLPGCGFKSAVAAWLRLLQRCCCMAASGAGAPAQQR
jgi:hypothetical protein